MDSEINNKKDELEDFGDRFVGEMRKETAKKPKPLQEKDLIDVFSENGDFKFRGKVKSSVEGEDKVTVSVIDSADDDVTVNKKNVRHSDGLTPSATLKKWNEARDVDESISPI